LKLSQYSLSEKYYRQALLIASKIKAKELIKNAYHGLYQFYVIKGASDSALKYQTMYYQLNDSIYSLESKSRITELENKYAFKRKEQEIKILKAEQELSDIKLRNNEIWLFVLIGGILIAVFFFVIIYYQMTQKIRANRELVRKNLEIVRSEEENRKVIGVDENGMIKSSRKNFADKYSGSALSETQKDDLKNLITSCMEKEKQFLNSVFTIDMFSRHLNISRTYISQVINEKFEMNFNSFINEYRIKEARRLLSDPKNSHLTYETIAREVGFGSKSTFNAAFKKYTGVTPSFYSKTSNH